MVGLAGTRNKTGNQGSNNDAAIAETNIDRAFAAQGYKLFELLLAAKKSSEKPEQLLSQLVMVEIMRPMAWSINTGGYGSATVQTETVYMLRQQAPKSNFWGQRQLVTSAAVDAITREEYDQLVRC